MTFQQYQREVGRRIRTARWLRGWTQEEAASRAKITYRYYSELERGRANPTLATLFDLARTFGRRAADFLDVEPPIRNAIALGDADAKPPPVGRKPKPRRR